MLELARLGAIVLPAMPGFYHRPSSVQDLVDFVVSKILDRLRVDHALVRRWSTPPAPAEQGSMWEEGEA
jgi:4-hydroxy-3-polyprenylbenzoate decarboxylase